MTGSFTSLFFSRPLTTFSLIARRCTVRGVLLLSIGTGTPGLDAAQSLADTYHGTVNRVVDGDTIRVDINGRNNRVRLIGIDALEKSDNEKAEKDASRLHQSEAIAQRGGVQASQYLSSLLKRGDEVTLVTDKKEYDLYGRMLAYIYDSHGTFINKKLIGEGYAGVLVYAPNDQKADELCETFNIAKQQHRGLWGEGFVLPYRWKKER